MKGTRKTRKSSRDALHHLKLFSTKSRKSGHCAYAPFSAFLGHRSRKGQWFIIAGLTIITMISAIMSSRPSVLIGPNIEPWQKYLFENVRIESVSAINTMLHENATSKNVEERSKDYLDFLQNFGDSHGVNISSYFIVGIPAGNDVNISIINFERSELQNVSITIDGATQTISLIPDRNSTTLVFSSAPDYFTVNYTLTEMNTTGQLEVTRQAFATTKKVFSIIKTRIDSKDGNQIWQKTEWN